MRLLDLPDALREMDVEPVLVAGWETRGRPYDGAPQLHLRHHTAGPKTGVAPSLRTVTFGRPDLPYNLCTVLQTREGGTKPDRAMVVSSGIAIHAGAGAWAGITAGNSRSTGNEIEHSGRDDEPWPANRVETSIRIAAACQLLAPKPAGKYCCDHREWALPPGRKIDTRLSGPALRAGVDELFTGPPQEDDDMAPQPYSLWKFPDHPAVYRVAADGQSAVHIASKGVQLFDQALLRLGGYKDPIHEATKPAKAGDFDSDRWLRGILAAPGSLAKAP